VLNFPDDAGVEESEDEIDDESSGEEEEEEEEESSEGSDEAVGEEESSDDEEAVPPANPTSQYRGVFWCKANSKWLVHIRAGAKNVHLGYFRFEEEKAAARFGRGWDELARKCRKSQPPPSPSPLARRTYDVAAVNVFGVAVQINFPGRDEWGETVAVVDREAVARMVCQG